MILQTAILNVKPGTASDFESRFRKAQALLSGANGYVSHELHKCVEEDGRYMLLVRWRTLSDHIVGFDRSPARETWDSQLQEYYDGEPKFEHYIRIRLE